MTQQQFPQPGYAPQQAYPPAQQQYPAPPVQQYPQVAQQPFPQQAYPQPQAQPQQPAQPLAEGSLDAFYSQPSASTGPSISWTNKDGSQKPVGTSYAGIVARDVTHADVQQQTDMRTNAPLFYRDGRPKFAMKVPLKVQPSPEFPDGEATWFVKGQARDELVRAMKEAGKDGAPEGGAGIVITLVGRRNSGAGLNPANIVQVQYTPPAGGQHGAGAPSPAPEPQAVQQAPVQQQQQAPVQQQGGFVPQVTQQQVPYTPQPSASVPFTQQQVPVQQGQPVPPADLSPEQQALLAKLTGQGQG